jgi:transposase
MDVHKDAMAVASVAQDHGAEVIYLGAMGTRQGDIAHLIRQRLSKATPLLFLSEGGPWGSWLSRSLTQKGDDCWVVAPSRMPNQPGDRGTTARRDAVQLARLARSGDRTGVYVPTVEDDAMRDLPRARADALSDCKDATRRLTAVLLRHALRSVGRANGGPAHRRWLAEVGCPTPALHIVLQAYVRDVHAHSARRHLLAHERHAHVTAWRLSPVVDALRALRGAMHRGGPPRSRHGGPDAV